ncbi:hypothetical protein G9A89_022190 [Geosiphon pyriformis]|nr:hypothetical protein G9A89_022190 [Geosiphon pyriformis]
MMSKHIVRLCRHIILDDFGEYVDRVAKVLLEKGRVSFYTIRRLSQLDVRKIKESLLILIQHNLAYWAEIPENNRSVVYYHIEIKEVLARDRFGIYLRHCDELTGHAYQILLFLLLNGKVTLKSLIEELEGIGKSDIIPDIKLCFTSLVDHSYLIPVQISDTQSALDKRNVAEAIKLREQAIVLPTKKELAEIRARIDQDKRASDEAVTQSLKRKADDPRPLDPNKAQKTQEILDEDIYFRVNYERFNILERNAQIVSFAEERFNKSAAHVMRMILQNANEWKSNYGKPESVPLSFTTIVKMISPSSGIANEIVIKKEREDPTHYQVLKHYLDILAENDAKFLRKKDDQMGGIYLVLYQDICDKMKQTKVESILQEKYGRHSVRIFRILLTKGKLDEHNIARFALLSYLETRKLLNDLFLADYIQLQEIPKGTERTPSRTIFLWYVDLDNTYKKVLADLYRSLANLYDRRLYECGKRQKLIEKRDRASIIGNEALLSEQEKQAAAVFEKVLERIERAEVRLVELIMLMSDFK